MTQLKLQELRKQAKERGLRGYSTMDRGELGLLLVGKKVPKRLKKNQVSVGTQTDFPPCNDCGLRALLTHLSFKADAKRRIVADDGVEIDAETGEVVGYELDHSRGY